jgi:hypothetical protein
MIGRRMAANTHPKKLRDERATVMASVVIEHRRGGKFAGEHYATEKCELCSGRRD